MEKPPNHPLVIVTEDDVKVIRELYLIGDVNQINESMDAIEEWIKKEEHLVEASKYLNRVSIERMLLIAKGSVEETKRRLERLLTARGMLPELCANRTLEEFEEIWDAVNYVPLPKLCPHDRSRVMVTQFSPQHMDKFSMLSYLRYNFLIGEYRINFDYSPAERFILDLKNVHIGLLSKLNPIIMKKADILCSECAGTKIKGIHLLNAPSFVDKFVSILKQALREKMANRVHVHNTYEDLHKHIPKEILPKDYGGHEVSCDKLNELWKETLKGEEAQKIIKDTEKLMSDETKRHESKFNEEYMGMPGSFRMLTVD